MIKRPFSKSLTWIGLNKSRDYHSLSYLSLFAGANSKKGSKASSSSKDQEKNLDEELPIESNAEVDEIRVEGLNKNTIKQLKEEHGGEKAAKGVTKGYEGSEQLQSNP